jgi:hypothetical protein
VEVNGSSKHSRLLRFSDNYSYKKIIVQAPAVKSYFQQKNYTMGDYDELSKDNPGIV